MIGARTAPYCRKPPSHARRYLRDEGDKMQEEQEHIPVSYCTGNGQHHIQSILNRHGMPNDHHRAGQPYDTITFEEIATSLSAPELCHKKHAPWMLASGYHQPDARTFAVQEHHGFMLALAIDVDRGFPVFENVLTVAKGLLKGYRMVAYTTSSALEMSQRCRVIWPLSQPIPYQDFKCLQQSIFAGFEHNGVHVDHTLDRAAQLIFLPSIQQTGAFYKYYQQQGPSFDPTDADNPVNKYAATLYHAEAQRKEAAAKASKGAGASSNSVISWVNSQFTTEGLMDGYGYLYSDTHKEWSSPYQQQGSGKFSTMIRPDASWFSLSDSDKGHGLGLGRPTPRGIQGDAFDLIVHYAFANNRYEALLWARKQRRRVQAADPVHQRVVSMVEGMLK